MNELSTAQQIHQHLGLPINIEHKQAHGNQNASTTKAGPGRYHAAGATKSTPAKSKGAPRGFVQHTNPERHSRSKQVIAVHGVRQWKRMQYSARRLVEIGALSA